jgi:benzoyl-CoA reductase/2-hydroxyglutaryl-CoA dehydratase subunit BcrC/BadD/HgdB
MCQYVRSTIDVAVEGGYDHLEGVIFVNSCDAMRRLHDVWKHFIPSKFIYLMDLPMGNSSTGVNYLKTEFQNLINAIEDYTGKKIENNKLQESMDIYAESRDVFNKLNSLRMEDPPLLSGELVMKIAHEYFFSDPVDFINKYKQVLKKYESLKETDVKKKPRVLLSGSPIHDPRFIEFIEDCGVNVIYEDICTGSKFFDIDIKKSDDLLDSLSNAYLNRTPCARMMKIEERAKSIHEVAEKLKIDGVIHHTLKFCDVYLYDVPQLKELLNEKDLSVLFIESDGRLGSLDQLKTRIEAFSEMIGG